MSERKQTKTRDCNVTSNLLSLEAAEIWMMVTLQGKMYLPPFALLVA